MRAGQVGGVPELPLVVDPDIGREFLADGVAEPKAQLEVLQARAEHPGRIGAGSEVGLDTGLEDQLLGEPQVVRAFQPA